MKRKLTKEEKRELRDQVKASGQRSGIIIVHIAGTPTMVEIKDSEIVVAHTGKRLPVPEEWMV